MPNQKKLSRTRFIRAYLLTFRILWRYLWLFTLKRLVKENRYQILALRAHKKTSKQIVRGILNLRGLYIKIGQTLSVMSNILPPELTDDLEHLQDRVPPHDFTEVDQRFISDFGQSAAKIFDHIDPQPIASASLGQVHVATHKNGAKLAVKVQYPNIEELTKGDLKTIRNIFSILNFFFPHYQLKGVFEECSRIILDELDYEKEAQNIEKIGANFTDNSSIVFPKVYHDLSSKKVLVLSFIEGHKVTQVPHNPDNLNQRHELAVDLIHFYCKQIFQDGLYHADPHPGNIIITPEGKIGMIDFGAVASISPQMRKGLTLFVEGLIKKDTRLLSQSLQMMGFISKINDEETLDIVVDYFYSKIRGIKIDSFKNLDVSQFQNLNDLVELKKMDISLKDLTSLFVIPRDWVLLERSLILMSGLTAQLDENLNPIEIVMPYVEKFLLGDEKKLSEILLSTSKDLILSYISLPEDIRRFIKKANNEGLRINARGLKKELSGIRQSVSLVAVSLMAMTSGILSFLLHDRGQLETAFRFEIGFYTFGVLFLLMLIKR